MIHYHGTPITPTPILESLAGRHFCVSYADPRQVERCHRLGQSVMLDNGAFSFWRQGGTQPDWGGYYAWVERWTDHPTTWAVVPDVIDGTVEQNDLLISEYPRDLFKRSAPVWHMHEPIDRLLYMCMAWPKVCVGSSGRYATVGSPQWHRRMEDVFNRVCPNGPPGVWLHMLRGMAMCEGPYPFGSADSTDIARNHNGNITRGGPAKNAVAMADRWDSRQPPARWTFREQLEFEAG